MCRNCEIYTKKVPDVARYLKSRYTHVFIDEYQDCGAVQHEIFMHMVDAGIKGIAVGDVNQAIYAFSDRYPEYLISLTKKTDFTTYSITRNHRCHASISKYSLALMGINTGSIEDEKRVYLVNYNGDEAVAAKHFNDKIDKICKKYNLTERRQIAILCRGKSTIDRISKATPHKDRLRLSTSSLLYLFRHLAQKSLDIRQYACGIFVQPDEKSTANPMHCSLCGIALTLCPFPVITSTNKVIAKYLKFCRW